MQKIQTFTPTIVYKNFATKKTNSLNHKKGVRKPAQPSDPISVPYHKT